MTRLKLIAHRGYPEHFPENTIVGIGAAIDAGARYIETDIQLTADQVPVLFHDRDLQRICGVKGAIHQLSLPEIRSLRASEPERLGDAFTHTRIATLTELVQLLQQHPKVKAFIEIKRISIEQFGITIVLDKIMRELKPIKKQCALISFSLDVLLAARRQGWHSLGAVVEHWRDRKKQIMRAIKPRYLFCNADKLPRWRPIVAGDMRLVVYEITNPRRARRLAERGVSYVETFAIGEMLEKLSSPSIR